MVTLEILFLKNHAQNVVRRLVPTPFLKSQNWAYLWINSLKFYTVWFYCMSKWRTTKTPKMLLSLTSLYKAFLKNKKRVRTSFLASSPAWNLKKYISLVILSLPNFITWIIFASWDIWRYVYCNYSFASLWCRKFWN